MTDLIRSSLMLQFMAIHALACAILVLLLNCRKLWRWSWKLLTIFKWMYMDHISSQELLKQTNISCLIGYDRNMLCHSCPRIGSIHANALNTSIINLAWTFNYIDTVKIRFVVSIIHSFTSYNFLITIVEEWETRSWLLPYQFLS